MTFEEAVRVGSEYIAVDWDADPDGRVLYVGDSRQMAVKVLDKRARDVPDSHPTLMRRAFPYIRDLSAEPFGQGRDMETDFRQKCAKHEDDDFWDDFWPEVDA